MELVLRQCRICKETKVIEQFILDKRSELGRAYKCKDCHNAYVRKWKYENKEHVAARNRDQYQKDALRRRAHRREKYQENKATERIQHKKWCQENKERIAIYDKSRPRDKVRAAVNKYAAANKDKLKKHRGTPLSRYASYKKVAKYKGVDFTLTIEQWVAFGNGPCAYCGTHVTGTRLDRTEPKKGYTPDNVVLCCTKCNYAKHEMSVEEFHAHILKMYTYIYNGVSVASLVEYNERIAG
jgi:post-segregation antitoxin (ccd killing protein)